MIFISIKINKECLCDNVFIVIFYRNRLTIEKEIHIVHLKYRIEASLFHFLLSNKYCK